MFEIKGILAGIDKLLIKCSTKKQSDDILYYLDHTGYVWISGDIPSTSVDYWNKFKEDTIYVLETNSKQIFYTCSASNAGEGSKQLMTAEIFFSLQERYHENLDIADFLFSYSVTTSYGYQYKKGDLFTWKADPYKGIVILLKDATFETLSSNFFVVRDSNNETVSQTVCLKFEDLIQMEDMEISLKIKK